ncbi:MAG: amino acid adenylation domain-containing protein [Muribaculaceae bacterium]|nr:amino acid adenylation domain-containing protein [Muribaculaceae bacterium]
MRTKLSQSQLGIYLASINQTEDENYNNPIYFELPASTDLDRLARTVEAFVEAHPYVKGHIVTDENGDLCMEDNDAPFKCPIIDVDDFDTFKLTLGGSYALLGADLAEAAIYRDSRGAYLFFNINHVVLDGTGVVIMSKEISRGYAGETLEAEPFTGHDVSQLEQEVRNSDFMREASEWYENEYAGVERPSPIASVSNGLTGFCKERFPLDIDQKALRTATRRNRTAKSTFFNAAFALMLSRLSGETRASYATVHSGRDDNRTARTIDMLVRTLPVSLDCSPARTVDELLIDSDRQTNDSRRYSAAYSFGDFCHATSFDVSVNFVFQGFVNSVPLRIEGEDLYFLDLRKHEPGFNINFELRLAPEGYYLLEVSYNTGKYTHDFIAQLVRCFESVANGLTTCTGTLGEIEMLNADDKARIEALSAGEEMDYDTSKTFVDVFKQRVAEQPDAVAVSDRDAEITYGALDCRSDILATQLIASGVEPDQFVALMMDRSIEFPLSVIAIHKAGAAYTPLDVEYPNERLAYMLENSQAKVLVTKHAVLEAKLAEGGLSTDGVKVIFLDDIDWNAAVAPVEPLATPQSLAYMIYTSGSTGKPKGVMLHQAGLMNFTWSMVKIEKLTAQDRTASHRSFSFDAHIGDIYPILTAGGQLHIMPSEIRKDLQAMADFITSRKINGTGGTTSLMMLLINSFPELPLRFITAGGEKLSGVSSDSMTIINLYGPTECTNDSTTFTINPGEVYDNIPIGRPMPNMRCYIMSPDGVMLPQGVAGELVVAGIQVGRGYWQLPEKTAEVFVTRGGETMYRTGDLARYNLDGQIEYLGRIDGQVKLRGYRIELGEIDAVASSCEGIRQAASQVREVNGQRHLVLYYTLEDGATVTDSTLAAHIEASSLAEYMHPEIYMHLEAMPLLPNGKINRKALPTPEASPEDATGEDSSNIELNPLETEIKEIIASALGTDAFGLTTPLSRIGLTSLTAIKVSVLVYKRYGVSLDAKTLGKDGSIRTIANAVVEQFVNGNVNANANVNGNVPAASTAGNGGVATLSYPQQGVYFDIMKNPDSVAYNIPTCYDLGTEVTVDDVVKAASQVVEAHPILSAHFEMQDGEAVQVIPDNVKAVVATASVDSDEEFEAMKEGYVQPFDIAAGPLYRLTAVSTPSGVKLLADFLHLVMDGSSLGIFSNQLVAALNGTKPEGEQYDYINYVADEKASRETEAFAQSKEYFAGRMATVDGASCIPEDVKSGEDVQGMLAMASTPVDIKAASEFARSLGITPAALFLAAAGYTVSRYCNTPDVCMATISNGRSNVKVSDTVGMFVNTIALTTHLTDSTVKDYIKACATEFENAVAHENYPFAELSAAYDLHPDVFFQYQLGMHSTLKVGDNNVEITHFGHPQPKFKMIVSIEEDAAGNARIEMQYDDSCYTAELAQGIADAMATVLAGFISAPEAPVKKVSMLSAAQAQLISTFHETQRAEVPIKLYHKLFEKSVAEHSDQLAMAAVDGEFTYDSLNRHMNRLAHALIERGIKRGDRVALLLPRTSRLIMSQYGVLKAGGAYIPCDPKYPTDRINHILDDSEAPFIITTADRLEEFPGRAVDVEELLKNTDETNPDVYVEPDDLAYLIYTSGSTGTPKGVQLMHKGVCNYHCDKNLIQGILKNECHAALGITTISFDMSVWETGSPLMLGKTLVLVGDDDCNDPNALAALIDKYHVDCMTATTSRFMQLLESDVFYAAFERNMHMAYQGGEGLSLALLRKLQGFPRLRIVNGYGPTETIANSHASELTVGDIPHIGKPCVNYTNFIVDNDGNEVPVGVIGELLIGGASVAKGYNNLPEQTAARFVDGVYHSGDYARWLPDGNVMVLGRKDNQVKLRGLRIELGEVESTMVKVEGIKSAVVLIKKLQGKDHLCAYFTADREIDIADLKAQLKKTLTLYMIPTAYLQVDEFPLTPNGKTNVKVLPDPVIAQSTDQVAASNETEQQFCDIFASILQLDKVGATDDFFELGGTSLVVIKVVIEATKLGYQVAFQDVFAHSTPRALAEFVGATPAETVQEEKPADETASTDVYASVLKDNTIQSLINGESQPIGDVLLTGATGFLGIHVLYHLLKEYDGKIYCPLRGKDGVSAADRLHSMLYYYFDEAFEELLDKRLFIIETNMMKLEAVMQLPYKNLTVINCLANVKHFSTGNDIEEVNVNSVEYLVKWCLASGSRLVHVSTVSVAGHSMNGFPDPKRKLIERELDYGQSLDNQYARSKFNAERLILDAVRDNGLSAKIMRVGNLSARNSDGEFQMNFMSNNFMSTLRAYQSLGACTYEWMDFTCEFSPIDEVSRAILLLATTPRENIVFHPTNNHTLPMGDVLRGMHVIGSDIKFVEKAEFDAVIKKATEDEEMTLRLRPLMAYAASGGNKVVNLGYDNSFTTQALYRLGFSWAYTSWDYVERFIKSIAGLDFFD